MAARARWTVVEDGGGWKGFALPTFYMHADCSLASTGMLSLTYMQVWHVLACAKADISFMHVFMGLAYIGRTCMLFTCMQHACY